MASTPPPDRRMHDDGIDDDFQDDAALRWDDVEDASWVEASHSTASERGDAPGDDGVSGTDLVADEDSSRGSAASGRASTLITAVGAVVFAAYTVAWLIGIGGLTLTGPTFLLEVVYQFAEFLAIIASVLWFGATIVLTRGRPARRGAWLALGTLLLLPWPFVLGVIA